MLGCQVMTKPASSRCNLDCQYCFYIAKPPRPVMSEATLECFIKQYISAQTGPDVHFAWQGGEPTLCGLDFFRLVWNYSDVMARQTYYKCLSNQWDIAYR